MSETIRQIPKVLALAAAAMLSAPISAQPGPMPGLIEVAANATWLHEAAKVRFPPQIDGLRRTRVQDLGDQRFDVSATYTDESSGSTATIYLFRVAEPDVSLWHDRP